MTELLSTISVDQILSGTGGIDHGLLGWQAVSTEGHYVRSPRESLGTANLDGESRERHDRAAGNLVSRYGAVRRLEFRGCVVVGQGSVVTCGGSVVEESALEFLIHGRAPDGFALAGAGLEMRDAPTRLVERPCVLVKRPWFRNYGHWLVDGAALLSLAAVRGLPDDVQIVVGCCEEPGMRSIVRESLAVLALGRAVLEHPDDEIWRFARLHYVTPVHRPPLFKLPEGIRRLREAILGPPAARTVAGRRLFVLRNIVGKRELLNLGAVLSLCERWGFATIRPETLSLQDQARAFAAADIVVGVKGAALTNLLFCRPGTAAIVLSPGDFPDPFFWDLGSIAGVCVTEIFGELGRADLVRGTNPFTIAVADFVRAMTQCGLRSG